MAEYASGIKRVRELQEWVRKAWQKKKGDQKT